MTHPSELKLALYAGGDLSGLDRIRTAWHVRRCAECAAAAASFNETTAALREEAPSWTPAGDWDRIAAEMTGNIRVGLAAGECVAPAAQMKQRPGWRAGAVLASATVMLMAAWWLNVPHPRRLAANAVVLQSTPAGIEMKQNGSALELLHRGGSQTIYVSAPRSLRSRSVDAETGQVTIYNVYAD